MKVCLLTHTFPKNPNDSTAAFLHPFVRGLHASGERVFVLTPYHKDLKTSTFPYPIFVYKYIWPQQFHLLGYSSTFKNATTLPVVAYVLVPFLFFFGTLRLLYLIKKEHIDIISAHWIFPSGVMAAIASLLSRVPFSVTLPGSDVYIASQNGVFGYMAKFVTERAGAVIADSPVFMDKIKSIGARPKTAAIIPYPVDTTIFKPNTKSKAIQKRISLLAVGRLVEKKGFRYLIAALGDIVGKGFKVRLVIVGDGGLSQNLKDYAHELRVYKYIEFEGSASRERLLSFYQSADIFIMPSIADVRGNIDDQPVALLEAMSCGLPVVATNFPGITLTVKDGINGYLVKQKDIDSIAASIVKLMRSPKLRLSMGVASRKQAQSLFSSKIIANRYKIIFQKIIHEK